MYNLLLLWSLSALGRTNRQTIMIDIINDKNIIADTTLATTI